MTSNPAASPALRSSPFSSWGRHCISTTVRTSCPDRKRRTPTGTFLSNRMRNSVALGVSHNRLDAIRGQFKLFGDFGNAHAIVEVIDIALTGIRVPRSTGAPLCTPCLISTNGHSDQSTLSCVATATSRPPSCHVLACDANLNAGDIANMVSFGISFFLQPTLDKC
jgi:hypothetical protein